MGIRYATREAVKRALDSAETARNNAQIDAALDASTDSIHGLTHRIFYPQTGTKYFEWPNDQLGTAYRLWLDENELVSVTSMTSGGIAITDYFLEPNGSGPPYDRVEIDLGGQDAFGGGPTRQRDVTITGVWAGCPAVEASVGTLATTINASTTTVDLTAGTAGVGDLIRVDTERLQVTGRQSVTTGATITADVSDSRAVTAVPVSSATGFTVDELVLIDAERMRIVDIAGSNLIVERAADGSVLAAHITGATVYAQRRYTVERAAAGTTAASHTGGVSVVRHVPPPLITQLSVAEALTTLGAQASGYARTAGSDENATDVSGAGIASLRERVYTRFGRIRKGVI